MAKTWTGSSEHRRLSEKLRTSGNRFSSVAQPLLRSAFREQVGGSDSEDCGLAEPHLAWSQQEGPFLVAACLWIEDIPSEADRTRRCVEAIQAFRSSHVKTKVFLLVHSRDQQESDFRAAIQEELQALLDAGQAERAELWNRQRILHEAFHGMLRHTLAALETHALSSAPINAIPTDFMPLEQVPYRESTLLINQYQWKDTLSETEPKIADPADPILNPDEPYLGLLIGEFGLGKTTAVARALSRHTAHLLYLAGARIGKGEVSAKDFFLHFFDDGELITDLPAEEQSTFRLLARPVIEYILTGNTRLPLVVVVDGVDESAVLSRRGGFQHLFNIFQEVRFPIVLTMRTELWVESRDDFAKVFGLPPQRVEPRNRRVRLVELLPWGDEQIRLLLGRYREGLHEPEGRQRLMELEGLLGGGEFERLFGDIPRRPLFLRLLLDTVAEVGLPSIRLGRARLLHDWVRWKILRDIDDPIRSGGEGRDDLLSEHESSETVIDLAWEAMLRAAALMVEPVEGVLDLSAECPVELVLRSSPRLAQIKEPRALFLHSLLSPVGRKTLGTSRSLRFAHRTFQEFFLAWYSLLEPGLLSAGALPPTVADWARAIQEEGLVALPFGREAALPAFSQPTPQTVFGEGRGEPPDLEIQVHTNFRDGRTHFDFVLHSPSGVVDCHHYKVLGKPIMGRPEEYRAHLLQKLEGLGGGRDVDGDPLLFAEIEGKLTGIGRGLFEELFPPEMKRVYRRFQKRVRSLTVISDEPYIPWELVRPYDDSDPDDIIDDDFLCLQFALTRWRRGEKAPAEEIRVRRLACFVGKELPNSGRERELLVGLSSSHPGVEDASPVEASAAALETLLDRGGVQLLHFAGHGDFDPAQPNESALRFPDRAFRSGDLHGERMTHIARDRPLVFLNACRVAGQAWSLTGLDGWAERWVRGCGAFVGPLWAVNDRLAFEFARALYGALEKGETLGEAAREARREVRKLYPGQPTWLAYQVYGHVKARILLRDSLEP
jgi:hypothetical protein